MVSPGNGLAERSVIPAYISTTITCMLDLFRDTKRNTKLVSAVILRDRTSVILLGSA